MVKPSMASLNNSSHSNSVMTSTKTEENFFFHDFLYYNSFEDDHCTFVICENFHALILISQQIQLSISDFLNSDNVNGIQYLGAGLIIIFEPCSCKLFLIIYISSRLYHDVV